MRVCAGMLGKLSDEGWQEVINLIDKKIGE